MPSLNKREIASVYSKRAGNYDVTANLYYLIGFREWAYRRMAVEALGLKRGDTVVEICCGTGLNFDLLEGAVGSEGKIVGVDLTDAMLNQARSRVERNGWSNVELVQSDAALFQFPQNVNGILSTFAITLVPEFDAVIKNGSQALAPDGRWIILDSKIPSNWLAHLLPLAVFLTRPFAVSAELGARHPWESVENHMDEHSFVELYGGFAYISAGRRRTASLPKGVTARSTTNGGAHGT